MVFNKSINIDKYYHFNQNLTNINQIKQTGGDDHNILGFGKSLHSEDSANKSSN